MSIIRCYGHFWRRDLVDWGEPGALMGTQGTVSDHPPVDFREQAGLYCLLEGETVVRVSETGLGQRRLLDKLCIDAFGPLRDRWTHFSWFGIFPVGADGAIDQGGASIMGGDDPRHVLTEFESILQTVLEPRLNRRSVHWPRAVEYHQKAENAAVFNTPRPAR